MFDPLTLLPSAAETPIPVEEPVAMVNGMVNRNCPPVAFEGALPNQVANGVESCTRTLLFCSVLPVGAVNVKVPLTMLRVVV